MMPTDHNQDEDELLLEDPDAIMDDDYGPDNSDEGD